MLCYVISYWYNYVDRPDAERAPGPPPPRGILFVLSLLCVRVRFLVVCVFVCVFWVTPASRSPFVGEPMMTGGALSGSRPAAGSREAGRRESSEGKMSARGVCSCRSRSLLPLAVRKPLLFLDARDKEALTGPPLTNIYIYICIYIYIYICIRVLCIYIYIYTYVYIYIYIYMYYIYIYIYIYILPLAGLTA